MGLIWYQGASSLLLSVAYVWCRVFLTKLGPVCPCRYLSFNSHLIRAYGSVGVKYDKELLSLEERIGSFYFFIPQVTTFSILWCYSSYLNIYQVGARYRLCVQAILNLARKILEILWYDIPCINLVTWFNIILSDNRNSFTPEFFLLAFLWSWWGPQSNPLVQRKSYSEHAWVAQVLHLYLEKWHRS